MAGRFATTPSKSTPVLVTHICIGAAIGAFCGNGLGRLITAFGPVALVLFIAYQILTHTASARAKIVDIGKLTIQSGIKIISENPTSSGLTVTALALTALGSWYGQCDQSRSDKLIAIGASASVISISFATLSRFSVTHLQSTPIQKILLQIAAIAGIALLGTYVGLFIGNARFQRKVLTFSEENFLQQMHRLKIFTIQNFISQSNNISVLGQILTKLPTLSNLTPSQKNQIYTCLMSVENTQLRLRVILESKDHLSIQQHKDLVKQALGIQALVPRVLNWILDQNDYWDSVETNFTALLDQVSSEEQLGTICTKLSNHAGIPINQKYSAYQSLISKCEALSYARLAEQVMHESKPHLSNSQHVQIFQYAIKQPSLLTGICLWALSQEGYSKLIPLDNLCENIPHIYNREVLSQLPEQITSAKIAEKAKIQLFYAMAKNPLCLCGAVLETFETNFSPDVLKLFVQFTLRENPSALPWVIKHSELWTLIEFNEVELKSDLNLVRDVSSNKDIPPDSKLKIYMALLKRLLSPQSRRLSPASVLAACKKDLSSEQLTKLATSALNPLLQDNDALKFLLQHADCSDQTFLEKLLGSIKTSPRQDSLCKAISQNSTVSDNDKLTVYKLCITNGQRSFTNILEPAYDTLPPELYFELINIVLAKEDQDSNLVRWANRLQDPDKALPMKILQIIIARCQSTQVLADIRSLVLNANSSYASSLIKPFMQKAIQIQNTEFILNFLGNLQQNKSRTQLGEALQAATRIESIRQEVLDWALDNTDEETFIEAIRPYADDYFIPTAVPFVTTQQDFRQIHCTYQLQIKNYFHTAVEKRWWNLAKFLVQNQPIYASIAQVKYAKTETFQYYNINDSVINQRLRSALQVINKLLNPSENNPITSPEVAIANDTTLTSPFELAKCARKKELALVIYLFNPTISLTVLQNSGWGAFIQTHKHYLNHFENHYERLNVSRDNPGNLAQARQKALTHLTTLKTCQLLSEKIIDQRQKSIDIAFEVLNHEGKHARYRYNLSREPFFLAAPSILFQYHPQCLPTAQSIQDAFKSAENNHHPKKCGSEKVYEKLCKERDNILAKLNTSAITASDARSALGISPETVLTKKTINQAFANRARDLHPDKNNGVNRTEEFQQAKEARDSLLKSLQ